jgi:5'-3' exonuclease
LATGPTLLVDAASLTYRAYFSTPDSVRARDGTPINAAHGFLGMVARLVADHDPDRICCAADENWRPDWRVKLIDTYKVHRVNPGGTAEKADRDIETQTPILFEILGLCGIKVLGYPDHEAEDVIGTLTAREKRPVAIVSGDRDLFQLVRDPDVWVVYPKRGVSVVERVDESYIEKKYGIPGRAYRDYAVLRGDTSDGLPGVRGIGDKIAASMIKKYGSIDAIIAAAEKENGGVAMEKVRRDLDYLKRAVKVVTIPTDLPLPDVDLTRPRSDPDDAVYPLAEKWALTGAVKRLVAALKSGG